MNISPYNPLLVAPKPVRLTGAPCPSYLPRSVPVRLVSAPTDQMDRLKIDDNDDDENVQSAGSLSEGSPGTTTDNGFSQRASSRCSLPSEALEEFLSILRPPFLPPSPTRHIRRSSGASSVPTVGIPYNIMRGRIELVSQQKSSELADVNETERPASAHHPGSYVADSPTSDEDEDNIYLPIRRWFDATSLSSPISRNLTRNPFQRHPSYDLSTQSPSSLPSASSTPLSPSVVPLPSPTPGELMIEVI